MNWETEHYSVLVIRRLHSFISEKKWEPDICIGFSAALHLQCVYCTEYRSFMCISLLEIKLVIITVVFSQVPPLANQNFLGKNLNMRDRCRLLEIKSFCAIKLMTFKNSQDVMYR